MEFKKKDDASKGDTTPTIFEDIREVGGFEYGRNDAIVATLKRITSNNIASYSYHIYEHWVDKDGKSHPKKRIKKNQYGKDQIAFSLMIKGVDVDTVKDWIRVFEDILKDQSELAEQLHDPESEKLQPEQGTDPNTDPLDPDDGEPF
jgi:hypothetical protein